MNIKCLFKKRNIIIIIVLLIFLGGIKALYFHPKRYYSIPLEHEISITHVNTDLHTISYYSKQYDGEISLLRGKIEGYKIWHEYLIGFLNTKFLKKQNLEKLRGKNDKHGYFLINMRNKQVISGLSEEEYKNIINNTIESGHQPSLKQLSPYSYRRVTGMLCSLFSIF